jgi:hypothetical protein
MLLQVKFVPVVCFNIYFNNRRAYKVPKMKKKDEFVQLVRLSSNEVASDNGRKMPKRVRKIVNMCLSHLKEII